MQILSARGHGRLPPPYVRHWLNSCLIGLLQCCPVCACVCLLVTVCLVKVRLVWLPTCLTWLDWSVAVTCRPVKPAISAVMMRLLGASTESQAACRWSDELRDVAATRAGYSTTTSLDYRYVRYVAFSSALDRPTGLRALAEVLLVPAGGDVRLGTAGALETAKVTSSLSDERRP